MEKKRKNLWRAIGLVALTIAVIAAVALTVWLANKTDDPKAVNASVGETLSTDFGAMRCQAVRFYDAFDGQTAGDGRVFLLVTLEIEAEKHYTVKSGSFTVDGKKPRRGTDCLYGGRALEAGESETIRLLFRVRSTGSEEYVLLGHGYRIRLGGAPFAGIF